jgi:hypothetical protein
VGLGRREERAVSAWVAVCRYGTHVIEKNLVLLRDASCCETP